MRKKQNIQPRNEHGQLHGFVIYYWGDGRLCSKQRWFNGELHGIYEDYWGGNLGYKSYYNYGKSVYDEFYGITNWIKFTI